MKLRPNEEVAIREALPVWKKTRGAILTPIKGKTSSPRSTWKCETADQILTRHGCGFTKSFTGDYHRYGIVETELRRRAREGE